MPMATRSVSRASSSVGASPTKGTSTTTTTTTRSSSVATSWTHKPTTITVAWLAIAIPLVTWDFIYCLGRPYTMPGGSLHWPLYVPYKLYGEIDHVYGWKAYNAGNGFTAAQSLLNIIETLMYSWYLYATVIKPARDSRTAARALLVGFSAAVMTLSKTVLYGEFARRRRRRSGSCIASWILTSR